MLWTLAGNGVYAACQWGMLIALAKVSPPETVGKFALGLAITAPVFAFFNMQLSAIQATDTREIHAFDAYLGFRIATSSLAMVVVTLIALLARYDQETMLVILLFGFAKAVESLSELTYGLFQRREEMHRIGISLLLKGPLSLGALILGVAWWGEVSLGILLLAITWACLFAAYDLPAALTIVRKPGISQWTRATFARLEMRAILRQALPMGIVIMLNAVSMNLPRYFVSEYQGEAALGYFAAIAYLLVAGSMIINSLGLVITPILARYFDSDIEAYKALLFRSLLGSVALGGGGIFVSYLFGAELLSFLYEESYGQHEGVLLWTMIGALILYCVSILGCGLSAAKHFTGQAAVTVHSTFAILMGCYLLVPVYGMAGGAMAFAGGLSIKLILQLFQVRFLIKTVQWHGPNSLAPHRTIR